VLYFYLFFNFNFAPRALILSCSVHEPWFPGCSLYIDSFYKDACQQTPNSVTEIEINPDTSWQAVRDEPAAPAAPVAPASQNVAHVAIAHSQNSPATFSITAPVSLS
jgi:hypothetical protein